MRAFVYYLHTVRRVGKGRDIEGGGKYLLLHLCKCDILGVECGPETWRRGGGSEGRFIPFLCGGEKSDILQNNHFQVESST